MNILPFKIGDPVYHEVADWYFKRIGVHLRAEVCSDFGFAAFHGEKAICAIFAFPIAGCVTSIVGHCVADTGLDQEIRRAGLALVTQAAENFLQGLGYEFVLSYPEHESAVEMYKRSGFAEIGQAVTVFKKLGGIL